MALLALVALIVSWPLFTFAGAEGEVTTEVMPAPSAQLPKATTSNGRASLRLTSLRPLTIAGRGFRSGERVRVSGAGTKRIVASRRGAFTLRMASRDQCAGLTITAVGSLGSRATLNFSQLLCAAP